MKVIHFEIQYQRETHSMVSKPEKKIKHLKRKLKIKQLHCKLININFTVQKKTSTQIITLYEAMLFSKTERKFVSWFITCISGAVVDTRRRPSKLAAIRLWSSTGVFNKLTAMILSTGAS